MRISDGDGTADRLAAVLGDLASALRSNTSSEGVVYDLQITFGWERAHRDYARVSATVGAEAVEVSATPTGLRVTL
jgi:hypothetical protein